VGQLGIGYQSGRWQVNLFAWCYGGAGRGGVTFNNPDRGIDFCTVVLNLDLGLQFRCLIIWKRPVYLEKSGR